MANEIVKYSNDFHTAALSKLPPADAKVFFVIIQKLKEKGGQEVVFTWKELQHLAGLTGDRHSVRFADRLKNILTTIGSLVIWHTHEDGFSGFTLFQEFDVVFSEQTLKVQISPSFEYALNNLNANFVLWELPQFLGLRSKYAQALFRHLKQFRSTGFWTVGIDEFRRLLDVPKSYRITNITTQVITPAISELSPFFRSLSWHYEKKRGAGAKGGRGGTVDRVVFSFQTSLELDRSEPDVLQIEGT